MLVTGTSWSTRKKFKKFPRGDVSGDFITLFLSLGALGRVNLCWKPSELRRASGAHVSDAPSSLHLPAIPRDAAGDAAPMLTYFSSLSQVVRPATSAAELLGGEEDGSGLGM